MKRARENRKENLDSESEEIRRRAKKSLGQHFLTDKNILEKIVRAGEITSDDLVLEIGPGEGALTKSLLETGAKIIAIEKDNELIPVLEERFAEEIVTGKFSLLHSDVLDSKEFLEDLFQNKNYKVVANIPYYITRKIVRFLFSLKTLPETIVLLVQNEVAERVVSDKESLLSLSVKAFGTPRYRGKVKAGSFSPPPKVDSAILSIENISRDFFSNISEEEFFETIRAAFSQKRKTLLSTIFSEDKNRGQEIIARAELLPTVRPEEIHLDTWKKLLQFLYEEKSDE